MAKRKLIGYYKNGNYSVRLYDDGSKIKLSQQDEFVADFPDSIDLKITDRCDMGCPMCHERSSQNGLHCDIYLPLLKDLHAGTELAIGGGNPLSHPKLEELLRQMKRQGVICNITVNERHFLKNIPLIKSYMDEKLVWGLGISINGCLDKTLDFAMQNQNTVLHCICGIINESTAFKLYDKNLKILLLGYKDFGRGKAFHSADTDANIAWLKDNITEFSNRFSVVSFDNLALSQLDMRNKVPPSVFEKRYMGDEGTASMYIDLVKKEFAVSSTSQIRFPLGDRTLLKAFETVKQEAAKL